MQDSREKFGSRFAVVMAFAGSAIGLGNIWRFPYMVGEHGGAAFIIVYIICSLLVAIPIMYCESIIGKAAENGTYGAMCKLAPGTRWKLLGYVTVFTNFIITSYYCVVGGWSVDFLVRSCVSGFSGDGVTRIFGSMSSSVWEPLAMLTIFLGLSATIVAAGVKKGIEKFTKITMPLLFFLILAIVTYSVSLPGASEGVQYLIKPDFSKLDGPALASALGQAFFSMSLGVGCVLVYSSYMKQDESLFTSGLLTAVADTGFAIIAGFAVMPAVFAAGLKPEAGPSLIFETLPFIFGKMGVATPIISRVASIVFFITILTAALTSSISMMEVCVEFLSSRTRLSRKQSSLFFFCTCWILGALCSLSFGCLSDVKMFGQNIFGFCDMLASNFLMTFGALAFSIFVGWIMKRETVWKTATNNGTLKGSVKVFPAIYFVIKWVIPPVILFIWVTSLLV